MRTDGAKAPIQPRRRMRRLAGIAVFVASGVALAACGGGNSSASGDTRSADSGYGRTATSAPPADAMSTIDIATNPTLGQQVLVDSKGMTLYLFVPDGAATQSTVPAEFKPNWPPVTTVGAPVAGAGLDMTGVGVQTQSDGTDQVTYNGHLLYTFINDKAPGDAMGQGLGPGNWFVLDADGNPIMAPAPGA